MFRTIAILSCAGGIAHANPAPMSVHADGVRMTHLYHNAATGETIASMPVGLRGTTPALVWGTLSSGACAGQPVVGALIADDPADPDRFGLIHMDWGDITPGTVVSMVQFGVATDYPDADLNGDGLPSGVPGLGVRLAFHAGENGVGGGGGGGASAEVGEVILMNLPGRVGPADVIVGYYLTVDLAGGVALGSTDVDGDGLADFGYSIEYLHPDFGLPWKTYLLLGAPSGQAVPDGGGAGGWTIIPDPAPNAQGTTDAIDVYRRDLSGEPEFVETIGGQFSCDPKGTAFYAQIALSLFADPAAACPADLFPPGAPDGQLNFFDLSAYLGLFNAQDPAADFFPAGGDGQFNFFDVSAYLAAFNAGCP